ncbi:hypothetical protein BT96DRAFT_832651, partial [Gymnopus androsaceus JB14]
MQPFKRQCTTATQDFIPLGPNRNNEDNFFEISSREVGLDTRGNTCTVPLSPQKHRTTTWTRRQVWEPEDQNDVGLDVTSEEFDQAVDMDLIVDELPQPLSLQSQEKKPKKLLRALRPHQYWCGNCQDLYLDELLRWEGRGDSIGQSMCPDCRSRNRDTALGEHIFHCKDCFYGDLVCQWCCVARHSQDPFHRIEKWEGGFFKRATLKDLGLVVQLNHSSRVCPKPTICHCKLRIFHWNGIHEVKLNFCNCRKKIPHHIQLLHHGLYPA